MRNKSLTAFFCILLAAFSIILPKLTLAYEQEINSLSTAMAEKIAAAGKKTIAVVDFTDLQGNVTELGRFLAEEFSVALAGTSKGFEVVDRTHLKSILVEHKLSSTGLIDPQTARKLGQIIGVDALITGTITPFGDSIRISVKVLDTTTAKVVSASTANIAKTKAIEELLASGIESPQSSSQQVTATGYVPSASSPNSKKIGPLAIIMKKIIVSKGYVSVYIEFANQSRDTEFRLAQDIDVGTPTLVDEKGNTFSFENRLSSLPAFNGRLSTSGFKSYGFTLPPQTANEMTLTFKNEDVKELGYYFAVSLKYKLWNSKDESTSNYNVSFTDIKAQKN